MVIDSHELNIASQLYFSFLFLLLEFVKHKENITLQYCEKSLTMRFMDAVIVSSDKDEAF